MAIRREVGQIYVIAIRKPDEMHIVGSSRLDYLFASLTERFLCRSRVDPASGTLGVLAGDDTQLDHPRGRSVCTCDVTKEHERDDLDALV